MTGMRGGELSSYGWKEAQVAASCKQDIEYSVSIKGGNRLAEEILNFHEKFCCKDWFVWFVGWLLSWFGR